MRDALLACAFWSGIAWICFSTLEYLFPGFASNLFNVHLLLIASLASALGAALIPSKDNNSSQ